MHIFLCLGMLFLQGHSAKAEPMCRRTVQIYERVFGPDHVNVGASLHSVGIILAERVRAIGITKQRRSIDTVATLLV